MEMLSPNLKDDSTGNKMKYGFSNEDNRDKTI